MHWHPIVAATLATFLSVACSAPTDPEDSGSSEGELSSTTPVTGDNFSSHPKIQAIDAEVSAIDAAQLTVHTKGPTHETCEATLSKSTDDAGKIRKFVALTEAFREITKTYYFNASGRVQMVSRLDVTPPSSIDPRPRYFEQRAYAYVERSSAAPSRDEVRWLVVERTAPSEAFRPSTGLLVGCGLPPFVDPRVAIKPAEVFARGCVAPDRPTSPLGLAVCSPE